MRRVETEVVPQILAAGGDLDGRHFLGVRRHEIDSTFFASH